MMCNIDRFLYVPFILSIVTIIGCSNRQFKPIVIDGKEYCITKEKIFSEAWYSCYLRGISCADCREETCLIKARDELRRAIERGKDDGRWVRTYGTHRLPEYFPNRELGIIYYHLYKLTEDPHNLDRALGFLEISINQCTSAKAKYYLNKVRGKKLFLTGKDTESPQLELDPILKLTNASSYILAGRARDDTYVGNIYISLNNEEPLSLLELSKEFFCDFQQKILLQSGINTISIRVVDLMGRETEQNITILFDQEGPMVYFAEAEKETISSQYFIQGVLYDPSEVRLFSINDQEVQLSKVRINEGIQESISSLAYTFSYYPSLQEQKEGIFHYRAIDSLENITSGTMPIFIDGQQISLKVASSRYSGSVQIAMASQIVASDLIGPAFSYQKEDEEPSEPIQITITQIPSETFIDEISPQITILAHHKISEIWINERPVLELYGMNFKQIFLLIKRNIYGEKGGSFSFPRIIKLKEGENDITVKVIDHKGDSWEKSVHVIKKTRQIHAPDERWRMTIHFESYNYDSNVDQNIKKSIIQKLIKAFWGQERFWVVDFENLEQIIKEVNLSYYIDVPYLGLRNHHEIMVDVFLLVHVQEGPDSVNFLGSLIDFETGVILATKEVFEEIQSQGISSPAWAEEKREHIYHNCCVLAAKFKAHFPLCEGSVISLIGEEMKTTICINDGLKEKMKLIIYDGHHQMDDFTIMSEARVSKVLKTDSLAKLLGKIYNGDIDSKNVTNLKVITR